MSRVAFAPDVRCVHRDTRLPGEGHRCSRRASPGRVLARGRGSLRGSLLVCVLSGSGHTLYTRDGTLATADCVLPSVVLCFSERLVVANA